MIQLILLQLSENLRIPVKTQATALRGLVLNRVLFGAFLCTKGFCPILLIEKIHCYLDIIVTRNTFERGSKRQHLGKVRKMEFLTKTLLFTKRENSNFNFSETL